MVSLTRPWCVLEAPNFAFERAHLTAEVSASLAVAAYWGASPGAARPPLGRVSSFSAGTCRALGG